MKSPASHADKKLRTLLEVCLLMLCSNELYAQEEWVGLVQRTRAALGIDGMTRFEFEAAGWEGCLGQPWQIEAGWARWRLSDYRRISDLSNGTSLQTARRQAGMDAGRLGGCGAQPGAEESVQQTAITASSDWQNQLPLWLTPPGILALADSQQTTVTQRSGELEAHFEVVQDAAAVPFTVLFDSAYRPVRVTTVVDDSVYGDLPVVAEFNDYQAMNGVNFPSQLIIKQGDFVTLSLEVRTVTPNTATPSELPARPAGLARGVVAPAAPEPYVAVAPGIFVSNGAYQSVIVDIGDGIAVIDGLQSDARAAELIAQAKQAVPGKPIRYVINTHAHFDHASGLRAFAAEGAALVTHRGNTSFFKAVLARPRTLSAAYRDSGWAMPIVAVDESFTLGDGRNRIELYHLQHSEHADDMLIAYLPALKVVVEADVLQPWLNPLFGGNRATPHPFLVHLDRELERLGLDYERFIPIHRPAEPPFDTKMALKQAVGR